jgi:hypothetical protein
MTPSECKLAKLTDADRWVGKKKAEARITASISKQLNFTGSQSMSSFFQRRLAEFPTHNSPENAVKRVGVSFEMMDEMFARLVGLGGACACVCVCVCV